MKFNKCLLGMMVFCPSLASATSFSDEIVVTASRVEESIASIPATVQVIDQEAIRQQALSGQHIGDVLGKLVPGFGVSSETNTHFNQTIRGRNALILIDGVPQYDNRNIGRQLQSISTSSIERVEVISGASAIYGAGSSGGLINIITKRPEKGPMQFKTHVGFSTSLEEFSSDAHQFTLNQTLQGGGDNFDYLLSATLEKSNNYYDANGQRIAPEPAQTSLNDTDHYDLMAKIGFDIDSDKRLNITLQTVESEQDTQYGPNYGGPGVPALFGVPVPVAAVPGLQLAEQPTTERNALTLDFSDKDFLGTHLRSQAFYRDRSYRFFPFGFIQNLAVQDNIAPLVRATSLTVASVSQSTSDVETYGIKLTFDKDLNSQSNLIWGFDYTREEGEQSASNYDVNNFLGSGGLTYTPTGQIIDYGPDVETKTLAGFLQGKFTLNEKLSFRAGIRHEDIKQDVSDTTTPLEAIFYNQYGAALAPLAPLLPPGTQLQAATLDGAELNYDATLFNLGFTYKTTDNSELFVNYSEGFETPDTARILRDVISVNSALPLLVKGLSEQTVVSETTLEAVKVKSAELGWRGQIDKVYMTATVFRNTSDKTIDFLPNFTVAQLDQDREVNGFELSFETDINERLSLGGSYYRAEGTTENKQLGRDLDLSSVEVSPPKTTLYGQYNAELFSLRLQATHLSDYNYDVVRGANVNRIQSGSYTSADLMADIKLPAGRLSVGIQNLTNKEYQTVYSQWAENVYGQTAGVPARGRMLHIAYTINY